MVRNKYIYIYTDTHAKKIFPRCKPEIKETQYITSVLYIVAKIDPVTTEVGRAWYY